MVWFVQCTGVHLYLLQHLYAEHAWELTRQINRAQRNHDTPEGAMEALWEGIGLVPHVNDPPTAHVAPSQPLHIQYRRVRIGQTEMGLSVRIGYDTDSNFNTSFSVVWVYRYFIIVIVQLTESTDNIENSLRRLHVSSVGAHALKELRDLERGHPSIACILHGSREWDS